jgi:hypothetical protein
VEINISKSKNYRFYHRITAYKKIARVKKAWNLKSCINNSALNPLNLTASKNTPHAKLILYLFSP